MKKNIHFDVLNNEEAQDILKCLMNPCFMLAKEKETHLKI